MPKAELVYANVLDGRVYEAEGAGGAPVVYGFAAPGRPLDFAVVRHWKAPQGVAVEQFRLIDPTGSVAYESQARPRRMPGQMDLTEIVDVVRDAELPTIGAYAAVLLIDGEAQGQVEFQYVLQLPSEKLPPEVEDGFRKTDALWIGVERNETEEVIPAWFAYQKGRVYVLHATDEGTGEQRIPGADETTDLLVISRHKYRDTRLRRFHATARVIEPGQPGWDEAAALLADRRRDRHGAPQEAIQAWSKGHVILELAPNVSV